MGKISAPISLAGSQLGQTRHVCAFFNSDEEEYRVLLPFIKDGFERGDRAIHIVNPDQRCDHLQRLTAIGIDTTTTQQRGQFELLTNTEAYRRDGRFDQDRMLAEFERWASGNAKGGFPLSRIVCCMDWAAEGCSHVDDLVEFESRVNDLWRQHDDAVICVYDLAKFGGHTVIDIMRTHPMIIIGGILQQNPFFVPPEEFLRDLRERRAAQSTSPSTPSNMEAQSERPAEEIKYLRRCMNDLVSLLALPAMWSVGDPSQIVRTLLYVLVGMLRLDLVYVRLEDPNGEAPIEMARFAQPRNLTVGSHEIGELLNQCLGNDPQKWTASVRTRIGDGDISIVPLQFGLRGKTGVIVAGCRRVEFPEQTERLLLSVAANQAAI